MEGLLGIEDFIQFVAMVLVLTLVAISTWVRKSIEKSQQKKGKSGPIDVGKAVREQLNKYMRAAGQLPPEAPPAPAPTAPTTTPKDPARRLVEAPIIPAVVLTEKRRKLAVTTTVKERVHLPSRFTPHDVRRAIVQAELLGPPMALRKDYRLF